MNNRNNNNNNNNNNNYYYYYYYYNYIHNNNHNIFNQGKPVSESCYQWGKRYQFQHRRIQATATNKDKNK